MSEGSSWHLEKFSKFGSCLREVPLPSILLMSVGSSWHLEIFSKFYSCLREVPCTSNTTHVCGQFLTVRNFFKILLMSEGSSTHVCGQFLTLKNFFSCLILMSVGSSWHLENFLGFTHVWGLSEGSSQHLENVSKIYSCLWAVPDT